MLCDEANVQKQKKRQEQIKKWREMDLIESQKPIEMKSDRMSRVRFPKSCVFLASCASGDLDEVKHHLKLGVNINTTNIDGLTALHQACIDANIDMVKFLVENGADLNAQDNEGWTPLHASVSVGNLEVSKYLVSKNAKLNVCNNDSDLPIDLCDSSNSQLRAFLEEEMKLQGIDADQEKQKEEMLMFEDAKDLNFFDKVHHKTGATPLHVSAAKGYTRVMKVLLQAGANVNALDNDGWTPLHAAAHWEEEEACRILGEFGANFEAKNYSGQTPFEVCDSDMANKLKAIQQKYKSSSSDSRDKSNDEENKNPTETKAERARKLSDEFAKSSILRLPNKTKSNLSDREKKQEKIVLTPIISAKGISEPKTPSFELEDDIKKPAVPEKNFERKSQIGEDISAESKNGDRINGTRPTIETKPSKLNEEPTLEKSSTAESKLDKPSLLSQDSRRYSCAPVASKDEQAELIRKQKAKLERHFRRSTQAVSYEDIKSAEASIKGSSQPSVPTSPTSHNTSTSTFTSEFGGSPNLSANENSSQSINPNSTTSSLGSNVLTESNHTNGHAHSNSSVGKLDSVSSVSLSSAASNGHTITSSTTRPLLTLQSSRVSSAASSSSSLPSASIFSSTTTSNSASDSAATSTTSATGPTLTAQLSANESIEKDTIIANDIETDKLLNEIEKSKGFSDTYSTTATRRLRNRLQNPYGMTSLSLNSGSGDDLSQFSIRPKNGSTNNKKINRLIWNEDRQELEVLDKSLQESKPSFADLPSSTTSQSKGTSSPIVLRKQTSLTDFDEKKDYQLAYENLKRDNERLNQTIVSLKKEIDEQAKRTTVQMNESSGWDKKERKAFDKRIAELEEEIKKMETLRQDNSRLKEENAALIRVISKLSK